MFIDRAILHDANPGTEPCNILEKLNGIGLKASSLGIETDVTVKIPRNGDAIDPSANREPCCISRDRLHRVPVTQYLSQFIEAGFAGPFMLDFIDRRAVAPVLKLLTKEENNALLGRLILQVPEIAMMYKTPWADKSGQFQVESEWKAAWSRMSINSRFPDLAREFLAHDEPVNLFWEPVDCSDYRRNRKELIANKSVSTIIYKMPHLTHSARFEPDHCFAADLDFFNSVSNEMRIIPLGSVDILRAHWRTLYSGEDSQNNAPI
jgi:hypothetical protein